MFDINTDLVLIKTEGDELTLSSFFSVDGEATYEYYNTINISEYEVGDGKEYDNYMEVLDETDMYRDEKIDIGHLKMLSVHSANAGELIKADSYEDALLVAINNSEKSKEKFFIFVV